MRLPPLHDQCPVCGQPYPRTPETQQGRRRRYCSNACKQWWYRWGRALEAAGYTKKRGPAKPWAWANARKIEKQKPNIAGKA